MILPDTSVWVDHFRVGLERLRLLIQQGNVMGHPWVIGELALGHIRNREEILSHLRTLPAAPSLAPDELLDFIESWKLPGLGIGWVDLHLLASARLCGAELWTRDKTLAQAARKLGVAYAEG